MAIYFDHEKLHVYQKAISLVAWCNGMLQAGSVTGQLRNQLERATTSIPLNIAEGNGKSSVRDRCRFLEISRASALECAACLDVLMVTERASEEDALPGKEMRREIVSMLTGLMASLSKRMAEEEGTYGLTVE